MRRNRSVQAPLTAVVRAAVPAMVGLALLIAILFTSVFTTPPTHAGAREDRGLLGTVPSALDGKVVHWLQMEYMFSPGIPDPANGKIVMGDIWELIGTTGMPVQFHGRYVLQDGTLHQEIVETPVKLAILYGSDYKSLWPGRANGNACEVSTQPAQPAQMRGMVPEFAQSSELAAAGYRLESGGQSKSPPSTASLPGVNPVRTYSSNGTVHRWIAQQPAKPQGTLVSTLEIDPVGRVIMDQVQTITVSQGTASESWNVYGSLQVYDPSAIPSSVFEFSAQDLGGC